ncbi:MAG: hypothetical protein CMH70_01200 [Nitrosomonadaceae bacterium]|nr:hypothetical protein [Nitrosomonadaceae bacterium]|tara:strand:+ start:624 stop:866 length:243 start_codon:yes stop_codon:yes gene_type:complete
MKILNILAFSIMIITNAHAGGVYGTLYNESDLVSSEGTFEDERDAKKAKAKKDKDRRAERDYERWVMEEEFNEARRRGRR